MAFNIKDFYSNFLGNKDPSKEAIKTIGQIPGQTQQYFDPFFQAGTNAIPGLQEKYTGLMNNPGQELNQIGQNYQQSPGFQFALQQALKGSGNAAAAGGMAGSPEHEQQNMGIASGLASQDYNNWLQNALGLFGQGLAGQEGFATRGQQAGQSMADMISQALAQKANLQYAGQASKNAASPLGLATGALKAFSNLS